ncbi:thioredoxin domain-containing protein [Micromonospora sp. HM5-17]|uniref:thioredoxin domain-containing protein n=1 Tax=Micromonospora sp. HM5-17 TaxID=2487710 RepID=UPI000F49691C|nr:thioredoxin domain-containing protein [Micromonospora sp. HM5-17]ROT31532.1 thioredoxin domain-containing protein [Micromonospora sp. HM5-17]
MNRLADATSPYLLQHRDNPVDWWPWSAEAFAEAARRDVPVLISVGYAACHWCHVMAHESFEDEDVARLLNDNFVSIKVDREERPDIDAVYMTATQAMTGQGGWPMTVFATPDGTPFFCGTYFPKPHFLQLLQSVTAAWTGRRAEVLRQGAAVVEAIGGAQAVGGSSSPLTVELLDAAADQLAREYDEVNGGFGGAPKFPPQMNLLFLLRHHQRTGSARDLEIVRHTCEAMARGGIYDQIAGGFARYSVDGHWTVPHFEKMLYDNAQLLRVYTQLWRLTGDEMAGRIAAETAAFLLEDLGTPDGGLASALDADAEGVEGATYVWTPEQLVGALGPDDGAWAADLFAVTEAGNFERGTSVLRLARDIDGADPELRERWRRVRARLRAVRDRRPQPARDDKIVAAWNGLAVTALVEYATLTADPVTTAAAVGIAEVLADRHIVDGRLRRVSRDGRVGTPAGVLEDYGAVAEAFCAVHQLTGQGRWLRLAGELLDTALERFATGQGGFYDTADDAERLVARPADPTDNATPSGLSSVSAALVTYAALTGQTRYREAAETALGTLAPIIARHARFTGYAAVVGEALLAGPYEIAVVTAEPAGDPLLAVAHRHAPPGAVVVAGRPDQPGVPLLANRPMRDGQSTAYVCRGFVCDRPVTRPEDLLSQLRPGNG